MLKKDLESLLREVKKGTLSIESALERLRALPFTDLGFAKVDHHRDLRRGFPEVIYCEGKTPAQIRKIAESLGQEGSTLLATRADRKAYQAIRQAIRGAKYHPGARMVVARGRKAEPGAPLVLVVTAGTSDIPVGEEAALTAEAMGSRVERIYDVGVAGIHRLLHHQRELHEAKVIVAVAGMEGALPSLVGGMVSCPVIAVPTSVGYGLSLEGLAAMLAMLNSCCPGIAVVNVDNGFGAGYLASLIVRG